MKNPLLLLSLLAALGATVPALAQSQDDAPAQDPAPEGETEGETEAAPLGGALDTGEPVVASAPQPYIRETFNDWGLQCLKPAEDAEEVCQMYQLLKDSNGANVAEASIFKLAGGGQAAAGGTFIVPLETLLTQKMTMQVDNGPARRYDFSFCAPIGCYARVGFTAEDISRFKAGAVAKVTIVPALAPDQKVTVEMSLSGFTAAYDAVSELNP